jgi:hypothetical protein
VRGRKCQWKWRNFLAGRSAVFPVGLALFDQGAQAFLGIFQAVQFIQENIHGVFQAVAQRESHTAENGAFGHGENGTGMAGDALDQVIHRGFELRLGNEPVDQTQIQGALRRDRFAEEHEFESDFRADEKRENRGGQRGKNANGNFRLGETRLGSGDNEVAESRQLRTAADRRAVHHTENRLGRFENSREDGVKRVEHLEDAFRSVFAYINAAAKGAAGRIEDDEFNLFAIGYGRDAIHHLAKHFFVEEVVLRAIQGQPGHAGIEAKLDKLKFLGCAALGFCSNLDTRAAFHDRVLLPGRPGSGAEFDASTLYRMEQVALERGCAMSLLVIRPVGSKVAVSALMRALSGAKGKFFLVSYVFQFASHPIRRCPYFFCVVAARAVYRSDLEAGTGRCSLGYLLWVSFAGALNYTIRRMNPPVSKNVSGLPVAFASRFASRPDAEGFPGSSAWMESSPQRFEHDWKGENADPARSTEVRLLWTPDTLYVRFLANYRTITVFPDAREDGWRDELWKRDVAEVFLQPESRDPWKYKEFEVSPNGQWIDLDIANRGKEELRSKLWRRVVQDALAKTWTAEMAIPMRSLTANFDPKQTWRVNFFRVEGEGEPRFYSAWSPTYSQEANFHVPGAFGKLAFRE